MKINYKMLKNAEVCSTAKGVFAELFGKTKNVAPTRKNLERFMLAYELRSNSYARRPSGLTRYFVWLTFNKLLKKASRGKIEIPDKYYGTNPNITTLMKVVKQYSNYKSRK